MQGALRPKFGERRQDWTCCFCCHVRTGAIFLGVWHSMLHILVIPFGSALINMYSRRNMRLDPILPTPLSEIDDDDDDNDTSDLFTSNHLYSSRTDDMYDTASLVRQKEQIGIVFNLIEFGCALMLLYGAIKGRSKYLMPFFYLQIFNFCMLCLSFVWCLLYLRPISQRFSEYSQALHAHMEPQVIGLLFVTVCLFTLAVKGYFLGIVWRCYRFLTLRELTSRQATITTTTHFIDQPVAVESGYVEPPDYDSVMKKYPTPPPSYSAVVTSSQPPPPPFNEQQTPAQQV